MNLKDLKKKVEKEGFESDEVTPLEFKEGGVYYGIYKGTQERMNKTTKEKFKIHVFEGEDGSLWSIPNSALLDKELEGGEDKAYALQYNGLKTTVSGRASYHHWVLKTE